MVRQWIQELEKTHQVRITENAGRGWVASTKNGTKICEASSLQELGRMLGSTETEAC